MAGEKCGEWINRIRAVVPGGSSTASKIPKWLPEEPGVIVRGRGCRVWDADGREFIDYRNALGPITLGYCFPATDEAIRRQLENGIVFGHAHPLECEVAELVCKCIPCAERARFLKTGGEAAAACIKLARHATGRDLIVQIGYNGWLNSLAAGTRILPGQEGPSVPPGVPRAIAALHRGCGWNDTEGVRKVFEESGKQIAAVVISADYARMEEGRAFYPFLREITTRYGALLVHDEIVTGFRVALGGVQEYFGVTPDLAVFAKGIANGMPLSVYCGKADVMDRLSEAIVSSTYGGEALSLAAAKATITTYRNENVIAHFWRMGERLTTGLNGVFRKRGLPLQLEGPPPCVALSFGRGAPPDLRGRFFRAAYKHGVSLYDVLYVNFSHTEADIDETVGRMEWAAAEL